MCNGNNEKRETTHDGRNSTTKPRKNQIARRKGNLIGNIGRGYDQTRGDLKKIEKEYLRRTRKLLETKLYCRNLLREINARGVPLVRYSGPFSKWTREELKQMD